MTTATDEYKIRIVGEDAASGVLGGIGQKLGGIGGIAKGALLGGVGLAVTGIGALAAGAGIAIKEAMGAQEVYAQLGAVLESTGGKAGVTADMAKELASSLMGVTRFEDDAILSGENMLLTFTNIGKDVFPDATKTMLDMSTALGQDVTASAMQLGKALNDPINGVTALRRVGVTFTEAQEEMIKKMVESGDVMGAQKLILKELSTEFGGSAEAAGKTFGGQLDILKNSLMDMVEGAGTTLLPLLTEGLQALTPVITEVAQKFADFIASDQFKEWITQISTFIREQLVPAVGQIIDFLGTVLPPIIEAIGWLWKNVLYPALEAVWKFIVDYVVPALKVIGAWLGEKVPEFLRNMKAAWDNNFMGVRSLLEGFFGYFKEIIEAVKAAFRGDWEDVGRHIRAALENLWEGIREFFGKIWEKIKEIDWAEVGRNIVEGIANGIVAFTDWVINAIIGLGRNVLLAIKGFLGISSPSKVFADEVGSEMGAGITLGLRRSLEGTNFNTIINPLMPGNFTAPTPIFGGSVFSPQPAFAAPASGQPIIFNYQPYISTASRHEAEFAIKPVIEGILREKGVR